MNLSKLDEFINSLENYDWFCDVEINKSQCIIYVSEMNLSVIQSIPDKIDGKHILFHFVNSQPGYFPKSQIISFSHNQAVINSIDSLSVKIDKLEKMCGFSILEDIFYEIHDGINAVTGYSDLYPKIRAELEILYNTYGFDMVHDLLV